MGKKWKSLLGEKHILGKPVHFPVYNTANKADTWGFIQQFFLCIGQQIQLFSWSDSRQNKFLGIGNSTFRQEEYSTAG